MSTDKNPDKPLINSKILLERMAGKGGWTYARIPLPDEDREGAAFGMVRVKGNIDDYVLESCSIMPMGNGSLFLPVNAAVRKAIKKEAGDYVQLTLYRDNEPYKIPADLQQRLEGEGVLNKFLSYKQWEQRMCAKWIYAAKRHETVNERIIKTVFKLKRNEKII